MKLSDAIKAFEGTFSEVVSEDSDGDVKSPLVWSGGVSGFKEISPALFSSEKKAVESWLIVALSQIPSKCYKLKWLIKPELMKYQITMADAKQQQRLVSDRYTVKSQFLVMGEEIGTV